MLDKRIMKKIFKISIMVSYMIQNIMKKHALIFSFNFSIAVFCPLFMSHFSRIPIYVNLNICSRLYIPKCILRSNVWKYSVRFRITKDTEVCHYTSYALIWYMREKETQNIGAFRDCYKRNTENTLIIKIHSYRVIGIVLIPI